MALLSSGFVLAPSVGRPIIETTIRLDSRKGRDAFPADVEFKVPQHDDIRVLINFEDENGDPRRVVGVTQITYSVLSSVKANTATFGKSLTDNSIQFGAPHQIYFDLTSSELGQLSPGTAYHEMRITNSLTKYRTVFAGAFSVQDTQIGD